MKKKAEEKMTRISITMPEELAEKLKEYASNQHRSVSAQVAMYIEQMLNQAESEGDDD